MWYIYTFMHRRALLAAPADTLTSTRWKYSITPPHPGHLHQTQTGEYFPGFPLNTAKALRFRKDEFPDGRVRLHVSQAKVCSKKIHASKHLKPGKKVFGCPPVFFFLCTIRSPRTYVIWCLKSWKKSALVGLFTVYCHGCRLLVGWSLLDEPETVRWHCALFCDVCTHICMRFAIILLNRLTDITQRAQDVLQCF